MARVAKTFEIIDHTADIGIVVYGENMKELFCNAGLALLGLITEPERVEEKLHRNLKVTSDDREGLLVNWLNELIYLFDAEQLMFCRFDVENLTDRQLEASCHGEKFDPNKHRIKRGVKAATYHMLKLEENDAGYKAQIILDI